MAFSESAHQRPSGWQQRALSRSLNQAQARSVDQMHRMVAAARDLANETGSAAFTVAQVARRAGLSLKVFYRCFAGKDELLLALIEEDSGIGATLLSEALAGHTDPVARLRAFVEAIFGLLTVSGAMGYAGVLVREHRRLSETYPDELRTALAPLLGLLAAELASAASAGAADIGDPDRTADTVFGVLLSGISDTTLGRADPDELAQWIWRFCWSGLEGPSADRPTRRRLQAHRGGRP